jgi:hypothetical protein
MESKTIQHHVGLSYCYSSEEYFIVWHLIYIETQQKKSPISGGSILRAFSWPRHKIEVFNLYNK